LVSQVLHLEAISKHLPSKIFAHMRFQAQIIQFLRNQVLQGLMTREQEQERLALIRATQGNISGSLSAPMSAPLTQGGMNVAPSSILTQSAGAVPTRRPTAEEVTFAKRWVEEQKRLAFNRSSFYFSHLISFV
jgi:hypothetical protein